MIVRFAPMFRSFNMLMLVILIGVVAWTFKVKHDSREIHNRVVELERKIAAQEVEIDLFRSDWSLLTSPARLENLIARYGDQLELGPMSPSQMTDLENLPPRRGELVVEPLPENAELTTEGQQTITGSIVAIPSTRPQTGEERP